MTRRTFDYICNQIGPLVEKMQTNAHNTISVDRKIAAVIWYLATNSEFCTIGHLFGLSQSFLCNAQEVCSAIVSKLMPIWIKMPSYERLVEQIRYIL
jgi:hypothetical protein